MKKALCLLFLIITCLSSHLMSSVHAFDSSLDGSWGLIMENEKEEIIRFNTAKKEIVIMNYLFRQGDYTSGNDTIYISNFDGNTVIIQYYRLAQNKLLFVFWNADNISESLTLILTKL